MFNKDLTLTGKLVQLEPLQESHRETLKVLSRNEKISTYSPALKLKFDRWFDKAIKTFSEAQQLTFIVKQKQCQVTPLNI